MSPVLWAGARIWGFLSSLLAYSDSVLFTYVFKLTHNNKRESYRNWDMTWLIRKLLWENNTTCGCWDLEISILSLFRVLLGLQDKSHLGHLDSWRSPEPLYILTNYSLCLWLDTKNRPNEGWWQKSLENPKFLRRPHRLTKKAGNSFIIYIYKCRPMN